MDKCEDCRIGFYYVDYEPGAFIYESDPTNGNWFGDSHEHFNFCPDCGIKIDINKLLQTEPNKENE